MGLKEGLEEFNKKPNAIYYYIAGIIGFLLFLGVITNPEAMGATLSGIIAIVFWLIVCYFCYRFCYSSHPQPQQQQQQQQQQIIMQTGDKEDKKMRVCPKCGMQNDVSNRFCSDCANEFTK